MISSLADRFNIDFIFISESKCTVSSLVPYFGKRGFKGFTGIYASNNKGGNVSYYLACVYGCPYISQRDLIWNTISDLMHVHEGKWILIGDINQLESVEQKPRGNNKIPGALTFNYWLIEHKLSQILSTGVKYTWCNNRTQDPIYEQLDRAYANNDWNFIFPNARVWNLPIMFFDHSPIVLEINPPTMKRKIPYRMEAWCLKLKEVQALVTTSWIKQVHGSHLCKAQRKIKSCLTDLRDEKGKEILKRKDREEKAVIKWWYWRQRAKSRWDAFGDQSTSFFYKSVKERSLKAEIRSIQLDNGSWTTDQREIKLQFQAFFSKLFNGLIQEQAQAQVHQEATTVKDQ
uniref:Endonuclease/exonuclease/phosphatase domain-containing protein n=1 Tax=Chenopodium quinoa TaxID=63459 RepID=A0A803MKK7_CHEQI